MPRFSIANRFRKRRQSRNQSAAQSVEFPPCSSSAVQMELVKYHTFDCCRQLSETISEIQRRYAAGCRAFVQQIRAELAGKCVYVPLDATTISDRLDPEGSCIQSANPAIERQIWLSQPHRLKREKVWRKSSLPQYPQPLGFIGQDQRTTCKSYLWVVKDSYPPNPKRHKTAGGSPRILVVAT